MTNLRFTILQLIEWALVLDSFHNPGLPRF